jgi:phage gp29-like protein
MPPASTSTLTPERVYWHKRTRFNPLRSLTPERLSQYLDGFRAGTLKEMAHVMEMIEERDDIVRTVSIKRKKDVARLPWEILTIETEDTAQKARAEEHKAALTHFFNHIEVTHALDQNERGGIRLLIRQMADAIGKRFAVHEIVWKPENGRDKARLRDAESLGDIPRLSAELRFVPLWFFESESGKLRFLPEDNAIEGVPMDPTSWLVSVGDGVMVACSVAYMYKRLPLSDWLTYCERHGMPGIRGITSASPGSDEWNRMVDAVASFSADFSAVMNEDERIEPIDLKGSGELPYPAMIERMDRVMTALWRGADLSTLSAGSGEGQGASVQAGETDLLLQDDAQWISETIERTLCRQVITQLFGNEPPLAYFKLIPPQKQDIEADIKIDEHLIKHGGKLSMSDAMERYGRAEADGEDVMEAAAPPAMPGAKPTPKALNNIKALSNILDIAKDIDCDCENIFVENLNCKKGYQCGRTCIARWMACRKDSGAAGMQMVQADAGPTPEAKAAVAPKPPEAPPEPESKIKFPFPDPKNSEEVAHNLAKALNEESNYSAKVWVGRNGEVRTYLKDQFGQQIGYVSTRQSKDGHEGYKSEFVLGERAKKYHRDKVPALLDEFKSVKKKAASPAPTPKPSTREEMYADAKVEAAKIGREVTSPAVESLIFRGRAEPTTKGSLIDSDRGMLMVIEGTSTYVSRKDIERRHDQVDFSMSEPGHETYLRVVRVAYTPEELAKAAEEERIKELKRKQNQLYNTASDFFNGAIMFADDTMEDSVEAAYLANITPKEKAHDEQRSLRAISLNRVAQAQADALAPLRARIETAMRSPDIDLNEALADVRRNLPAILENIDSTEVARALEETMGAALLTGLTEPFEEPAQ